LVIQLYQLRRAAECTVEPGTTDSVLVTLTDKYITRGGRDA
jgi:hypothetical protein